MYKFPENSKHYLICFFLALLVLSVYWQVGEYSFINYDDKKYVEDNPEVLKGLTVEGASWAFTTIYESNWHPLTWLSHMADVELFGLSKGWHHRMNVFYHLLNTELLFIVIWRMTGGLWQSAFVAALFGVHPLHVESVAWVAERKDVLSTLFWILTMGAYLRYVRFPSVRSYLPVVALFALGLMCKPMLVTLPFVLLLLDYWPLGRVGSGSTWPREAPRLLLEKIPLLALSAASSVVAHFAQASGKSISENLPLGERVANSLVSYSIYLWKTAWPVALSVFYPHPGTLGAVIPAWQTIGSILLLVGFTFLAIWQRRHRPYLGVGWLWYLGTLVPVIGLIQIGAHARADRYTYVPLIGVFMALAWGIPELLDRWRFRRVTLGVLGGAVVLALSVTSWNQAGYWRDSTTMFTHALHVDKKNWLAWNGLGVAHDHAGRYQQAIRCFNEAIRISPQYADAWSNMGNAYRKLGQTQKAIICYQEVLRIDPNHAVTWNNLGVAHGQRGQHQEAIPFFREALRIDPGYSDALRNLKMAYGKTGRH
jgi:protein O-mannosyl-transferase